MGLDFDLTLWLTVAVMVTAAMALFDVCFMKPKRKVAIGTYTEKAGEATDAQVLEKISLPPLWMDIPKSFFPVLLVVWALRSFLVEPFTIPSGSMLPTLRVGDFILVNKFEYGVRVPVLGARLFGDGTPQRGDIVVFKYPMDPGISYIKRAVGMPGDVIRYDNKQLYINGELMEKSIVAEVGLQRVLEQSVGDRSHKIWEFANKNRGFATEWTVPEGAYFMMGDNRDNSNDSRAWGFVEDKHIVGKAFAIWMHMPNWIPSFDRNRFLDDQ